MVTLLAVSCTEKVEDPSEANGGYAWPERHISKLTMQDGSFIDFVWDEEHLISVHSSTNTYQNNTLYVTDIVDYTITYSGEKVTRVSVDKIGITYYYHEYGDTSYDGSYVYDYVYDDKGLLIRQNDVCDGAQTFIVNYSYAKGKIVRMSVEDEKGRVFCLRGFEWSGDNISRLSADYYEVGSFSYDNHPNPMHFPFGSELFDVVRSELFDIGVEFHWNTNNIIEANGVQYHYDYDAGGHYPVRMYIEQEGENVIVAEYEYDK